jgi:hypothetical protein
MAPDSCSAYPAAGSSPPGLVVGTGKEPAPVCHRVPSRDPCPPLAARPTPGSLGLVVGTRQESAPLRCHRSARWFRPTTRANANATDMAGIGRRSGGV